MLSKDLEGMTVALPKATRNFYVGMSPCLTFVFFFCPNDFLCPLLWLELAMKLRLICRFFLMTKQNRTSSIYIFLIYRWTRSETTLTQPQHSHPIYRLIVETAVIQQLTTSLAIIYLSLIVMYDTRDTFITYVIWAFQISCFIVQHIFGVGPCTLRAK